MITIKRIQVERENKVQNAQEINNTEEYEDIIYEAADKEELLGKIVSRLEEDVLTVYELDGGGFILDGLVRAALNYAKELGAEKAFFKCGFTNELEKLGFNDGLNINRFFNNKNCKNSL